MTLHALVNLNTNQVVSTFDGVPGKMRVEIPDETNRIIMGASAGSEAPPFKVFTLTDVVVGSGPVVVSVDGPTYGSGAVTRTTTRRQKTSAEIDADKEANATVGLGTTQNKTILDALWEIHRAVRGVIILPTETKAQYADRLKAMWKGNEP